MYLKSYINLTGSFKGSIIKLTVNPITFEVKVACYLVLAAGVISHNLYSQYYGIYVINVMLWNVMEET